MARLPKQVGHLTQFGKIPGMDRVIKITVRCDLKMAPAPESASAASPALRELGGANAPGQRENRGAQLLQIIHVALLQRAQFRILDFVGRKHLCPPTKSDRKSTRLNSS